MPGYRLGNGTETDAREAANRGLPPIWKPYNPLHYFSFAYWAYTFNFSDLDMSKKYVVLFCLEGTGSIFSQRLRALFFFTQFLAYESAFNPS